MMRTYFVIFVALWGCVFTQPTENRTEIEEIELPPNFDEQINKLFTTERYDDDVTEPLEESKRNLTVESLIDRIVDLAIKRIKEKGAGPIKLSDEVKEFNRKFIIIPIKGEVILYNGFLTGVNSIERDGRTTYKVEDGKINVNLTVEFDELKFIYDFQANILKLSTDGVCKGAVNKLVAAVGLRLDIPKKEIILTRLKLLTVKTLTIQLDSAKFRDKVVNYILKTITTIFKSVLLTKLENELQSYIGTAIHYNAEAFH